MLVEFGSNRRANLDFINETEKEYNFGKLKPNHNEAGTKINYGWVEGEEAINQSTEGRINQIKFYKTSVFLCAFCVFWFFELFSDSRGSN